MIKLEKLITWTKLRRYIHNTNLNALFFATFSTMIVIISTNIIPSIAGEVEFDKYFNYESIIYILILFFFSSFFWFFAVLIYEIFVPDEMATYISVDQFVDTATSSPVYSTAEERIYIGVKMSKKWNEIDNFNPKARIISFIFALAAGVSYSITVIFLFLSLWSFLSQVCFLLDSLPFLCQFCS